MEVLRGKLETTNLNAPYEPYEDLDGILGLITQGNQTREGSSQQDERTFRTLGCTQLGIKGTQAQIQRE